MTKEEIIDMARKSDFEIYPNNLITWDGIDCTSELIAFAKLVAEHERKECADMIEDYENIDWNIWDCAKAIREREKE